MLKRSRRATQAGPLTWSLLLAVVLPAALGGDTLPQDKASIIEQIQAQGHVVCYVGDGVNEQLPQNLR